MWSLVRRIIGRRDTTTSPPARPEAPARGFRSPLESPEHATEVGLVAGMMGGDVVGAVVALHARDAVRATRPPATPPGPTAAGTPAAGTRRAGTPPAGGRAGS